MKVETFLIVLFDNKAVHILVNHYSNTRAKYKYLISLNITILERLELIWFNIQNRKDKTMFLIFFFSQKKISTCHSIDTAKSSQKAILSEKLCVKGSFYN